MRTKHQKGISEQQKRRLFRRNDGEVRGVRNRLETTRDDSQDRQTDKKWEGNMSRHELAFVSVRAWALTDLNGGCPLHVRRTKVGEAAAVARGALKAEERRWDTGRVDQSVSSWGSHHLETERLSMQVPHVLWNLGFEGASTASDFASQEILGDRGRDHEE